MEKFTTAIFLLLAIVAAAVTPTAPSQVRLEGAEIVWQQNSDANRACLTGYRPDWYETAIRACFVTAKGENRVQLVGFSEGWHLFIEEWDMGARPIDWLAEYGPYTLFPGLTITPTATTAGPAATPRPTGTPATIATPIPIGTAQPTRPPTPIGTPRAYLPNVRRP